MSYTDNIKVSVSLMTYNHEGYIEECLKSILNQKTSFKFEVIIGDDCSKDRTKEILHDYEKNNASIKLISRDENIGIHKNFLNILANCSGEFVALIEGDDFWIDEYKLQKQCDLLESNKGLSFCFGNAITFTDGFFEKGKLSYLEKDFPKESFDLHTYLNKAIAVPNNTKMFRREMFPNPLPEIFFKSIQWDWLLHVFMLLEGKGCYINEVFLGYRRHHNAVINVKNHEKIFKDAIYTVYNINKCLPNEYHSYFKHPLFELNSLAFHYLSNNKYYLFCKYYFKWIVLCSKKRINIRDEFYKFRKSLL